MLNLKQYFLRFQQEWSLSAKDLENASALTRFFRNYIGPIRFVTLSFILILIAIGYHYYQFYAQLTAHSPALSKDFYNFGVSSLALIVLLFVIALGNIFIMTTLIFKSADMIGETLEYPCDSPKNNFSVKCVFSRLNFMISSIEQNRFMIKAFQNDLLEKNRILDESEKKFRHVINTSPDAILVMDNQWNFIESNHTAQEMFGYTEAELQLLTPYNLASSNVSNCLIEDVMQQETDEFECTCIRKDATEFEVQIRLKRLERSKDDSHMLAIITDITERKKNIIRLKESLDEKEILLREIHHRVKNNMQIISSMLGIQAINSTNAEIKEILSGSQNRIMAMMLIHEKLYNTVDIAAIDFRKYTYELLQRLYDTYTSMNEHITYVIDAEKLILDIDTALYCGLIINELVSNAFKYAFSGRDKGEVKVTIEHHPDATVTLSVQDNGVGMDKEIDITRTKSLGLRLVYKLAKFQLKGNFSFTSDANGTKFNVTFSTRTPVESAQSTTYTI